MDLTPTERRLIRIIRSQLDLYESQGQAHVAGLIAQHAIELAGVADEAQRQRAAESSAQADADLKAFLKAPE